MVVLQSMLIVFVIHIIYLVASNAITGFRPGVFLNLSSSTFEAVRRMSRLAPHSNRDEKVEDVMVLFHNGRNSRTTVPLGQLATMLPTVPGFNSTLVTTLYLHGFVELPDDPSCSTVAAAYARIGTNFLLVDWSNMAFGGYLGAAMNVILVGKALGQQLLELVSSSTGSQAFPASRLHFVGYSLGAHGSAVAARILKRAGHTVGRITGLDPAFPGFYPPLLGTPLRKQDAALVDVLHTDAGHYGAPLPGGHVDYWPNGGLAPQPGCWPVTVQLSDQDFCSHEKAWRYWARAVLVPSSFQAVRCATYAQFQAGLCGHSAPVHLGRVDVMPGNYYFNTNY